MLSFVAVDSLDDDVDLRPVEDCEGCCTWFNYWEKNGSSGFSHNIPADPWQIPLSLQKFGFYQAI